jgi:hypothetical protein
MRLRAAFELAIVAIAALLACPVRAERVQAPAPLMVAFVTDSADKPLAGADVQIVGTQFRGVTNDDGRVALRTAAPGMYLLRVRRLGYAELLTRVLLTAGLTEPHYRLMPVATDLQKVVVRSSELKPDRYAGTTRFDAFYRRKSQGLGTFITREMIDARDAQKPEDLLRMVAGVRIRYRGSTPFVQFLRCDNVNVYIDGVRSHDAFRDYFALSPLDIEAMEIYHGLASVPPEFSPEPNDCAAIVVWTRWHGAK